MTLKNFIVFTLFTAFFTGSVPKQVSVPIYVSNAGAGTACTLSAPCSWVTGNSYLDPGETLIIVGTINRSLTFSRHGTAALPVTLIGGKIVGSPSAQNAFLVDGSYVIIRDLEVTGGLEFGLRTKGHHIMIIKANIHDNVLENRQGDSCRTDLTSGWGRGLTFGPASHHIEVADSYVYNNCGEGIGITGNEYTYIHNTEVHDNFSRNVYIDNADFVTLERLSDYYSMPNFQRIDRPNRCIGLAVETVFAAYGSGPHDIIIRDNKFSDCSNINFYSEVSGAHLENILVENNVFTNVPKPWADLTGVNVVIRNNTDGGIPPTVTPTPTKAPDVCASGTMIFQDVLYTICVFPR